jgi:phospholipase/carboxylesterase
MNQTIERIHGDAKPAHAVIWLHGLGATADDFVPVIPYLGLSEKLNIRFIFPQAPDRPITINGGYVMPGWYDIKGMDIADKEDRPGMVQSQNMLEALIAEQVANGVPSTHIVLAGFSQGGAVAYYTGIRSQQKLAGILALSTYLPFLSAIDQEHSRVNLNSPILAMHGKFDSVVPLSLGKMSADALSARGYRVLWREYEMEHSVIPEQITDIGRWINERFG